MIDVTKQIDAVTRTATSSGETQISTLSQVYPTDIEDMWDVVTNPERIPRWFLPISGDLKEGGHYQFEGNAGGTITRCDQPHSFTATWEFGESVSTITVRLTSVDEGHTRFELEHAGVPDPEFWAQYGPGATGLGWDGGMLGLALYLAASDPSASGAPFDKEAIAAWTMSPEGHELWRQSSEAWFAAHVAGGADPGTARAMADRSYGAYTGG